MYEKLSFGFATIGLTFQTIWQKGMAKNKTAETSIGVKEFIGLLENEKRRKDSIALIEIFKSVTGFEAKMWGPSIIGFGKYHYKYKSGHEGDAPLAAFAPRKDSLVLYFDTEFEDRDYLFSRLGKYKHTKCCVYVKKLEDVDLQVLRKMIHNCTAYTNELYPHRAV